MKESLSHDGCRPFSGEAVMPAGTGLKSSGKFLKKGF
jgi:hypothetical protein